MKKALNNIASISIGAILCAVGLLFIHLLSGCQPRIGDILKAEPPLVVFDTITTEKTITDTVLLAAELVPFFDSILCPPGLEVARYFYIHDTVMLPPRRVPVEIVVRDTVFIPQVVQTILPGEDMGWPERLTWLTGVFTLLFGLWKSWKDKQKQNPAGA
ncbi:MAG: hypothetical protein EPGJADBJ_04460 [Saprospiraceae bacterium]|nr:hypothetical protein [Saprospiraceae bacterium]